MAGRRRVITVQGLTFDTEIIRPGFFNFVLLRDGRWIHCGEGIHGRPSDPKAQRAMVHYAQLAAGGSA